VRKSGKKHKKSTANPNGGLFYASCYKYNSPKYTPSSIGKYAESKPPFGLVRVWEDFPNQLYASMGHRKEKGNENNTSVHICIIWYLRFVGGTRRDKMCCIKFVVYDMYGQSCGW